MKRYLIAAVVILGSSLAHAGAVNSGGGLAVVCRDLGKQIKSIELLDIYQARVEQHAQVFATTGSVEGDFTKAAEALDIYQQQGPITSSNRASTNAAIARFQNLLQFDDRDALPYTNDYGNVPAMPLGCSLEQVAIFYDTTPEKILVSRKLWNAMDSVNKSALMVHELIYQMERRLSSARTSSCTRAVVGFMYSTNLSNFDRNRFCSER